MSLPILLHFLEVIQMNKYVQRWKTYTIIYVVTGKSRSMMYVLQDFYILDNSIV